MRLRRFKPNPKRLRVAGLVLLSFGLIFLILSTVFPFPEGTWDFLSIGTSQKVLADTTPWLSGWAHRCNITIESDQLTDANDLTWFPVMVHISAACGIGSAYDASCVFDELTSDNNRFKIAVTTDDGGTQLYVEIEKWDDASEEAILWVSKTGWVIDSETDTTIYLYYDSSHDNNIAYVSDAQESRVQIDSSDYDAFGILIKASSDAVYYFYRKGSSHIGAGDFGTVYQCLYTPSTYSWGTPVEIYDASGSSYDCRSIKGGVIGSNIYLFFVRYDPSTDEDIDYGYIKSTDLAPVDSGDWGSYTTVTLSNDECRFHGHLVQTSTAGTYYQPYYGIDSGSTYELRLLKTTNSGSSWADSGVAIYSGSTAYVECCVEYIGSSKMIAIIRLNTGGYVYQIMSEDDGATWGTDVDHDDGVVAATNLGESTGVKVVYIYYDSGTDKCVALYADRYDGDGWERINISITDASTVFADETAWNTPRLVGMPVDGSSGYPSLVELDSGEYFYVYSNRVSASDEDTWGGYYSEAWGQVWDSNYKLVSHLHDHSSTSLTLDNTINRNYGVKKAAAGPAESTSGKIAKAQHFDGSDDYIKTPAMTLNDFTIELWVNADTLNAYRTILACNTGSSPSLLLRVNDNTTHAFFQVQDNEGDAIYSQSPFAHGMSTGTWYKWDLVIDGTTGYVYINNAQKDTDSDASFGSCTLPSSIYWGAKSTSIQYWDGLLDEIRVSNTVRSAAWRLASYETEIDNLLVWQGEETPTPEITNTPSSNDFGTLAVNGTGNTAINYFQIENTGNCVVDVVIYGTDATGGDDTWTLSDTATPGENIYGLKAGLDDDDDTFDVIVRKTATYNTLVNNLSENATQDWGLKIWMPTALSGYDNNQMSATITLVASEAT